jgi:hypothetical protein
VVPIIAQPFNSTKILSRLVKSAEELLAPTPSTGSPLHAAMAAGGGNGGGSGDATASGTLAPPHVTPGVGAAMVASAAAVAAAAAAALPAAGGILPDSAQVLGGLASASGTGGAGGSCAPYGAAAPREGTQAVTPPEPATSALVASPPVDIAGAAAGGRPPALAPTPSTAMSTSPAMSESLIVR